MFLPGGGSFGLDHLLVQEQLGDDVESVLYDRGGTGWSDDVEIPRSLSAVVEELRALLTRLGVPPPYILVGHSLGGAYARRFAQRHRDEVAGLVLLDPFHERWNAYQDTPLADTSPDDLGAEILDTAAEQVTSIMDRLLTGVPDDVRGPLRARHLDPDRLMTGFREGANLTELVTELAGAPDPQVPTIVVGATGIDEAQTLFVPREQLERMIAGQQRLYADHAAAGPDREYRVLPDSTHSSIPFDAAGSVAQAVRDVGKIVG